jgi:hypothetical protein
MTPSGSVGIIANPASGKDIRRLVAHGSTFDNNEKTNIVRRVLLALDALDVERVWYMPDLYGIVPRAAEPLTLELDLQSLPMVTFGNPSDSFEAAQRLADLQVDCIVSLGGDGTNRIVAKGGGDLPLMPISTGTNNVFPQMVEGTIAGLAAGLVAKRGSQGIVSRHPWLEIEIEGCSQDIALVDAVLTNQTWIGARAFWQSEHLVEILLARLSPAAIGICGLGGMLFPDPRPGAGAHISIGEGGKTYLTPLGPGLLRPVPVRAARVIDCGDRVEFTAVEGTLALDGEREIELRAGQQLRFELSADGPYVVNVDEALRIGARENLFLV